MTHEGVNQDRQKKTPRQVNSRGEEITDPDELPAKLIDYHEKLYSDALKYLGRRQASLAIIVAQTSVELCTEATLEELLRIQGVQEIREPILDLFLSYNICNERLFRIVNALSNDKIQQSSFWQDLKRLSSLRNDIVHRGKECSLNEAKKLIPAVGKFIQYSRRKIEQRKYDLDPPC